MNKQQAMKSTVNDVSFLLIEFFFPSPNKCKKVEVLIQLLHRIKVKRLGNVLKVSN